MLNKTSNAVRLATIGAVAASAVTFASTANAEPEVSASVAIANMYLWRGVDLGNGDPAVSGDITVSMGGLHAGIWASSGDAASGTEFDLILGYGGEFGDFSYDVSVVNYIYPTSEDSAGNELDDEFAEFSDLIVSLGFGPVSFGYYDNIAGSGTEKNKYYTLGAGFDAYSATIGYHDNDGSDADATHLDLSYAYNDNLAFTFSQFIDTADDEICPAAYTGCDDDPKIVVSYSLPIE